jgi:membrane-associated phospholipid phosphatase
MEHFLASFSKNILDSFRGKNFAWHLLAWLLTAVIVISGFDWSYFVFTRPLSFNVFFFLAVIIGGLLPIFGLPLMLLFGWLTKNTKTKILAWALGQAALIGYLISSFYKALTGRIPPPHSVAMDISQQFNFGFLKEGIFWGWPSSHTTVAFAMAFAMITLYSKNKAIRILAFIYALYIGIGVSFDIHWFSEFIAGAIIGTVIGIIVGKSFSPKFLTD